MATRVLEDKRIRNRYVERGIFRICLLQQHLRRAGLGKRTLIYSAPLQGLLLRASLHTTDRHQKAPHPAAPSQINLASLTA